MKKSLLKVSLLSLMLVVLGIFVVKTNAASTNVNITFTLNPGAAVSCSNSTNGGALSALTASTSQQVQTGTFTASSWTCTDLSGAAWSTQYTVVSSNLTANGGLSIASGNVKMQTTITTTNGNLTGTTELATLTAINTSKQIYNHTTTTMGTFTASPILVITVPANQVPRAYTGLITVSNPGY